MEFNMHACPDCVARERRIDPFYRCMIVIVKFTEIQSGYY